MEAAFIMGFMNNRNFLSMSTDPVRKKRMLFAALSGFIAGTIATLVSSYINTWFFPDLPFYFEWSSIFIAWLLWSVLGGLLAGVAGLSYEGWKGILFSALGMASSILLLNSIQSSESIMLKVIAFVGLLFPITAMVVPLAVIFFWLATRFVQVMSLAGWARWKIILVNSTVIVVLGLIPGVYAKMNSRAEQSVRLIHGILQNAQTSQPDALPKVLLKTKGFSEHKNQPYTFSQVSSAYSTVGVDVLAHYKDGYTILCTVVLYPERDPYIYPCKGQIP
jgi:MFS family permease